jgi:ribose 5-phosphate isomerase B
MKIYIATDHAGVVIKDDVKSILKRLGCQVIDLGPATTKRVDYTEFAHKLSKELLKDIGSFGILICGTGIGMSLAANKHSGIRAALCHDAYTAKMAREHNNANILCFGQRVVGLGTIESMLEAWVGSKFAEGRHANRVQMIEQF